jgi:hypothetical protein
MTTHQKDPNEVVMLPPDTLSHRSEEERRKGYQWALEDARMMAMNALHPKDVYTGETNEEGNPHGHGKMEYANGEKYEGQWKDNKLHGKGKYTYETGDVFEGEYQGSRKHGPALYRFSHGDIDAVLFVEGRPQGESVRWAADGRDAWVIENLQLGKKISLEKAAEIAGRVGVSPPFGGDGFKDTGV